MKKADITNSDMMRILVRILYEEYREIQKKLEDLASKTIPGFKKKKTDHSYKSEILLDVAKNDLRMDIGIENPIYLRGYIIVPELLLHEKFICVVPCLNFLRNSIKTGQLLLVKMGFHMGTK
jgi:hypothetical protein